MISPYNPEYVEVTYMQFQKYMSVDTGAFRCKCDFVDKDFDYYSMWHRWTCEWWHFKIRHGVGYHWDVETYKSIQI